ncbi:uncharacterized protein RCC_07401 [Ramularia collo-cygni]|uniref:Uncharacterized protein n=1 Tax=Ramularia collo-cygni TaxID=112498 RepID=A0A2D3V169_9PEZI|nr:uncharacterized protein RCC_07401 [Ramularia collo-cygni]CZT21538.1 uncharacterized protein RCC_07401 [Ramularia collo-cygni]
MHSSYEQAMESLRISDPDLHQKLTAALNQITDLPTSDYREKLVSGLNDIRQAAEDPWEEAFEKEESWVTQQLCGVKGHAVEALNDIAIILQEQVHNVRASLGQYGATISDSAFLITCFFLDGLLPHRRHLPTSGFSKLS